MNYVLLMAGGQGGQGGGGIMSFLPLIGIIVVFYFFMIRPQMKKQKDGKKFLENIKKGDKIVTIGGIIAKIVEVNDNNYIIETEGGVKLKILKSAVSMENSVSINKDESTASK